MIAMACHLQAQESANPAEQQLLLMINALDHQSYQGTLTYEFGGPLEALAFEHWVKPEGTQERIRHLGGNYRNFSRHLPKNYCGNAAMRLLREEGSPLQHLKHYYDLRLLGQNRIADRVANMIQIVPKDNERYGYTLGLDTNTYLPLMIAVTGLRNEVLERFQFIQLTVGPLNTAQVDTTAAAQHLPFASTSCNTPGPVAGWRPSWLPAGFVVASAQLDEGKAVLSYTDGLASLSIFTVPFDEASSAVGVVQRGATVAAMTLVAHKQRSHKVAVVGEVPAVIARKVAASVAFNESP
jgi:sigma-E factor negative regulatory protein RseB